MVSTDNAKVIAKMNEALQMELTSALRYLDFSFRIFGPTRKPIVSHFLEESEESFDHAKMLGDKIVALGGLPRVTAVASQTPDGATVDEMLKLAIKNEEEAVAIYSSLLELVGDETPLRVLFENQVLTEQEHLEEVTKMLRR